MPSVRARGRADASFRPPFLYDDVEDSHDDFKKSADARRAAAIAMQKMLISR